MKAYAIKHSLHSPRLCFFHYLMFHGREVAQAPYCRPVSPILGDDLSKPLYLIHNTRIPHAFVPSAINLVVSEEAKNALAGIPRIAFIPVCFHKIVDFPVYPAGDFSFRETVEFKRVLDGADIEHFLDRLPDIPALHNNVGCYYELVVTRLSDVSSQYDSVRPIICEMPMAATRKAELLLSSQLLRDYPVVWDSYTVFNADAFERISPFLDRDYFGIVELEV